MDSRDRSRRALTPAALAPYGITPGPHGYAWHDLITLADQHGWHVHVEPAWTPKLGPHYRALVWTEAQLNLPGGALARHHVRSRGITEEEALATALARLLHRTSPDTGFGAR